MNDLKKTKKCLLAFIIVFYAFFGNLSEQIYAVNQTDTLLPSSVILNTNLSGALSDIQEDVDSPDSNWLTALDTSSNTTSEGRFQPPQNTLETGVGLNAVKAVIRKNATGGASPTATLTVYEIVNGSRVQISTGSLLVPDGITVISVTFDATNLTNKSGTVLEYRIQGTASSGIESDIRTVEIGAVNWNTNYVLSVPAAPNNFAVADSTDTSIDLSWSGDSNTESYELKRDGVVIYSGSSTGFQDTGLVKGKTYQYSLTAINASGNSSPVSLEAAPYNLNKEEVSNLSETHTDNSTALSWKNPLDSNFVKVKIYRNNTFIGETGNESYVDNDLTHSTDYQYKLTTVNQNDVESQGVTISVKTSSQSRVIGVLHGSIASIDNTSQQDSSKLTDNNFDTYSSFEGTNNVEILWDIPSQSIEKLYLSGTERLPNSFNSIYIDFISNSVVKSTVSGNELSDNGMGYYTFTPLDDITSIRLRVEPNSTEISFDLTEFEIYETTDSTPPDEVTNVSETHTDTTINLSWENPGNSDFSHVRIYRDELLIIDNLSGTHFTDTEVNSSVSHTYKITTVDVNSNESLGKSITISPNDGLSLIAPNLINESGSLTIDGTVKTLTANLSVLKVSDNSEMSSGWNVNVTAAPFTEVEPIGSPYTLPTGNFRITGIDSIQQISGSSALPQVVNEGGSWFIDNGTIQIVSAGLGEGIGEFDISFLSPSLELKVDTSGNIVNNINTPITYQSTIVWTINAGP